jgi:cell pole-organizing protein PopZ
MSRTEQAPDANMEEILASIRRIISDDPGEERNRPQPTREWTRTSKKPPSNESFADSIARALSPMAKDVAPFIAEAQPGADAPKQEPLPLAARPTAVPAALAPFALDELFDAPTPAVAQPDETLVMDDDDIFELTATVALPEPDVAHPIFADAVTANDPPMAFTLPGHLLAGDDVTEPDDHEPFDLFAPTMPELTSPNLVLPELAEPLVESALWPVQDAPLAGDALAAIPAQTESVLATRVEPYFDAPVLESSDPLIDQDALSDSAKEFLQSATEDFVQQATLNAQEEAAPSVDPRVETMLIPAAAPDVERFQDEAPTPAPTIVLAPVPAAVANAFPDFLRVATAPDAPEVSAVSAHPEAVSIKAAEPVTASEPVARVETVEANVVAPDAVDALAEATARRIADTPTVQAAAAAMNEAVSAALQELPQADLPDTAQQLAVAIPGMPAESARALEDTVAQLLKPMLREWLDTNMPRIMEKALKQP